MAKSTWYSPEETLQVATPHNSTDIPQKKPCLATPHNSSELDSQKAGQTKALYNYTLISLPQPS